MTVPLVVYNTPQGVQTGEVIQSMAAEAGFAVQVQAMEFGTAIATVNIRCMGVISSMRTSCAAYR